MSNSAELLTAALHALHYVDLLLGAPVSTQARRLRAQTAELIRVRRPVAPTAQ